MATIEESVKTEVIAAIRRIKPSVYRMEMERMSQEQVQYFLQKQMEQGIYSVFAGRPFTEAERNELMEAWNGDEAPSDYQLIEHYQGYILDRFFDEWYDYFKTYRMSGQQAWITSS